MRREKFSKSHASQIVTLVIVLLAIQGVLFLFGKNEAAIPQEKRENYSHIAVYCDTSGQDYKKSEKPIKKLQVRRENEKGEIRAESAKSNLFPYRPKKEDNNSFKQERREIQPVQLNTADSIELVSLPGIGPYYARKIIQYREKLGGYAEKEQLMEIFGIDQERFNMFSGRIIVDSTYISKIDIEEATYEQLSVNPYIGGYLARSIIRFRESRSGMVTDLSSLLVSNIIKIELYKILKYYIR
ncbi:MAG: helix-hairpin-helix domain-containing protein [Rikenellaceae bacterium]|nr:helix-hairpin-helix domain-containing protein [Rikenellaceae bacterium]